MAIGDGIPGCAAAIAFRSRAIAEVALGHSEDMTFAAAEYLAAFPWLAVFDDDARRQFVDDFIRTARECAAAGEFDRLAIEIANWHETAVAYSRGLQTRPSEVDYLDAGLRKRRRR